MDSLFKNFFKFLLVGCIALFTDISIYFILLQFSWPSIAAKALSFCFGVAVGYILNSLFTFNNLKLIKQELKKYILVYSISLIVNLLINEFFLLLLDASPWSRYAFIIAVIFATTMSLLMNFLGLRYYVFKK